VQVKNCAFRAPHLYDDMNLTNNVHLSQKKNDLPVMTAPVKGKKVNVGFLYSAAHTMTGPARFTIS